jgi:hypothetical protein
MTEAITRFMMVGFGLGFGWILGKLTGLLGASPTAQWWAFYVPVVMLTAFAVSGFIADVTPIPRPLIYLALLAASFYGLAQQEAESPQQRSSTKPTTTTDDTAAGFHFAASLEGQYTVIGGLHGRNGCEKARKIYEGEGLRAGPCERDK